jgi:hypothetical protein
MLAHREAFSPLPKAKSARKVSPFCHIDQQIISETEGEPSQIRRDVKAIRAIRRRKFYFRSCHFYIFYKYLINIYRGANDRFATPISIGLVATNQTSGRSLPKVRAFSGHRGA